MVHVPGIRNKAADAVSRHPTGPLNPDKLVLPRPDDIASYHDTNIPFPFTENAQDILSNIRCPESPPNPVTDTEIALSASSALGNVAITWDRVKLATASDATMNQLVSSPITPHQMATSTQKNSNVQFYNTATPQTPLLSYPQHSVSLADP